MVRCFRDLKVWNKSMDVVINCYKLTEGFPSKEIYGLSRQIQRSAVSIPSNIAEGQQRQYTKEFIQFLSIASGSLAELETHLEIANRLEYLNVDQKKQVFAQLNELGKMIGSLRRVLKKKLATKH